MAWEFMRTFKARHGMCLVFSCEIREDGVPVETLDFTVDASQGAVEAARTLKLMIVDRIKLELLARSPAVQVPTVTTITAQDLA